MFQNPGHTPQWTCGVWEEVAKNEGVLWCVEHSLPLDITAVDGVALICSNGADRDPYEFNAKMSRHMKSLQDQL